MRISYLLFILLVIGMMVVIVERHWPRPISEISLSRQLPGNHCQFAFEAGYAFNQGGFYRSRTHNYKGDNLKRDRGASKDVAIGWDARVGFNIVIDLRLNTKHIIGCGALQQMEDIIY